MYGAITLLITYKNIWKNIRRPVKCTAVRARVELNCACLLGSLRPLDARHGTLTYSIRTSPLELWKQPTEQPYHSDHPVHRMNLLSLHDVYSFTIFCRYVFCCCLKQRPNFFQFERNVFPLNVTSNLHPCYLCWIHITLIMRCLQTSVPCCLCCVINIVCPTLVLLLHDFCKSDFTVCATTVLGHLRMSSFIMT